MPRGPMNAPTKNKVKHDAILYARIAAYAVKCLREEYKNRQITLDEAEELQAAEAVVAHAEQNGYLPKE